MPTIKDPIAELRKAREFRQKEAEKKARIEAMPQREIERREKRKLQTAELRRARLAKEEEDAKELRGIIKAREEQRLNEEKEKNDEKKSALLDQLRIEEEEQKQQQQLKASGDVRKGPSCKRRRNVGDGNDDRDDREDDTSPANIESSFFATPSRVEIDRLEESLKLETDTIRSNCKVDDVMSMATSRIFCSDPKEGVGVWGAGNDDFCKPLAWNTFIDEMNSLLLNRKTRTCVVENERGIKTTTTLNYFFGEYNYVIAGDELQPFIKSRMPMITNTDGNDVHLSDVVFRITRPDMGSDDSDDESDDADESNQSSKQQKTYRYRTLKDAAMEMHHVLQGSSFGFGAPCHAAFLFPATLRRNKMGKMVQLYGALYVMKRASKNLNVLVGDRTRFASEKHRTIDEAEACIRKGVKKFCTTKLLPKLATQAKLGVLNLDCKPGNILVHADSNISLTDFDPSMYTSASDFTSWTGCLLVNLLLLCVHSRSWHHAAFADAFTNAFKPLLLELVVQARCDKWIFDAVCKRVPFLPGEIRDASTAKGRLEAIVCSYFLPNNGASQEDLCAVFKLAPNFAIGKPLISSLLKFALTGSATANSPEIAKALGERM
jgi:hypothetical protein